MEFRKEMDGASIASIVGVSCQTFKYHHKTVLARLLLFPEDRAAYVIDMDIIDQSEEYRYLVFAKKHTTVKEGAQDELAVSLLRAAMLHFGIEDVRTGAGDVEARLVVLEAIEGVVHLGPARRALEEDGRLPADVVERVMAVEKGRTGSSIARRALARIVDDVRPDDPLHLAKTGPFTLIAVRAFGKRACYRLAPRSDSESVGEGEDEDDVWDELGPWGLQN